MSLNGTAPPKWATKTLARKYLPAMPCSWCVYCTRVLVLEDFNWYFKYPVCDACGIPRTVMITAGRALRAEKPQ